MDPRELATLTATPIQTLGMSFYFDPRTAERATELGLNVYEFYGLGRAGVLGNVEPDVVERAFNFFHSRTINLIYTKALDRAEPAQTAQRYVRAAFEFADRTFGAVSVDLLEGLAHGAHKVADAVPAGRHLLFDGYHRVAVPEDPWHAAYLGTIVLRELRGCVHIDAVAEAGLSASEACYLQDASVFALHGYHDDDAPPSSEGLAEKKVHAEELTERAMAECFAVLGADEQRTLADATLAMYDALSSPVPVLR
ncbi:MAG TPA: hypothetical protein VMV53_05525 [Acidimicrobiales bacterium]|nr:hypothetical protein [Acidimicrobiales bacterium]